MKAIVIRPYERPYAKPIAVAAGEFVTPDFAKTTPITGWVWCVARDGRSGWTPRGWLEQSGNCWRILRDFNAIELTVAIGEFLNVQFEESNFYWAVRENGEAGWVPVECVSPAGQTQFHDF